jgi:hypothetical protein
LHEPVQELEHPLLHSPLHDPEHAELQLLQPDDFELPLQVELHDEQLEEVEDPLHAPEQELPHPEDDEAPEQLDEHSFEHELLPLGDAGSSTSDPHPDILNPIDKRAMKGITLVTALFRNSLLPIFEDWPSFSSAFAFIFFISLTGPCQIILKF